MKRKRKQCHQTSKEMSGVITLLYDYVNIFVLAMTGTESSSTVNLKITLNEEGFKREPTQHSDLWEPT
eukprot:scaffold1707_cov39-Cyclotella_meneghiniana.AAC.4